MLGNQFVRRWQHKSFDPAVIKASFIAQGKFGHKFTKRKKWVGCRCSNVLKLWLMFPQKSTKWKKKARGRRNWDGCRRHRGDGYVEFTWQVSCMCSELWMMTASLPQEAAVVPRMLAQRVRHGLQLQLKRKEQINRILRKGLISTRRQLHRKKTRVVPSFTSQPLNMFTSRNKPAGKLFAFFFYSTSWGSTRRWVRRWRRRWKNSSRTKMKPLSTCTSRYLQKRQDAENDPVFNLQTREETTAAKLMFKIFLNFNTSPRCSGWRKTWNSLE